MEISDFVPNVKTEILSLQTPEYRTAQARIKEINRLLKAKGADLAALRRSGEGPLVDALDADIANLVRERGELRNTIKDAEKRLEALRVVRREAKIAKTSKPADVTKSSVFDLKGRPVTEVMSRCPTIVNEVSVLKYINPRTDWSDARLYFGMGGGSQNLTRALPADVISMLLASEVFRRTMGLKRCSVLVADVITRTNPFPLDRIQQVMEGEHAMMSYLTKLFGFDEGWDIVLHSDLHKRRDGTEVTKTDVQATDPEACVYPEYIRLLQIMYRHIDQGIARSPFADLGQDARGHEDNWHFALENSLTGYLVGNGIHFGWYIPGPDVTERSEVAALIDQYGRKGLKRMDEEPFDSYYLHTVDVARERGELIGEDQITPVYCAAGIRIPPRDKPDLVERTPPYICYYPDRNVLISDGPAEVRSKLEGIDFSSKGAFARYWRNYLALVKLFGLPCEGDTMIEQLSSFLAFVNRDGVIRELYQQTFRG